MSSKRATQAPCLSRTGLPGPLRNPAGRLSLTWGIAVSAILTQWSFI